MITEMETLTRVAPMRLPRATRPRTLSDLRLDELELRLEGMGEPGYRAKQVYGALYQTLAPGYDGMTTLPKALRATLADELPIAPLTIVDEVQTDDGETIKTLYETADGELIETVLMLYADRATVCVSCQVGCAVGCAFCATGLMGLARNLTAGEMVAQVTGAARRARAAGRELTNLVMMGMGEPFHNYAETMRLITILNEPAGMGFGARRITISTSGVVPRIEALADEPFQVNLAISIHAATDELRSRLVPINRRYPIAELMKAVHTYIRKTRRRVSFEYAMMAGINDDDAQARQLARLLKGTLCHVNLIPLNPVDVLPFERPTAARIDAFAAVLTAAGIPTTVRYSRGVDIAAACGQLRVEHERGPALVSLPTEAVNVV